MAGWIRNLPDHWSLTSRQESWNTNDGRTVTFKLTGPSTSPGGAQYDLVNQVLTLMPAGITQWNFEGKIWEVAPEDPDTGNDHEGGEGILTVIYQANASNPDATDPPDPADKRYGLVSLRWTREFTELEFPPSETPTIKEVASLGASYHNWVAQCTASAAAYRRAVAAYYKENPAGSSPPTIESFYPGEVDPSYNAIMTEYFISLCLNQELAWEERAPVLRKEMDVAAYTTLRASDAYSGKILNWAALQTHEPTLDQYLILSANLGSWYWLKMEPDVVQISFGKYQISQVYKGVKWWYLYMYGNALTPGDVTPSDPPALS